MAAQKHQPAAKLQKHGEKAWHGGKQSSASKSGIIGGKTASGEKRKQLMRANHAQ